MRPKVSGIFRYSSPSVKVSGIWKAIDKVFVNVAGVWKTTYVRGADNIVTNAIGDLLNNTSGWVYDATRGWYKDDYNWAIDLPVKFAPATLARIRKISVEITGYPNTPASCLGTNIIRVDTNLRSVMLGTYDSHSDPTYGQGVYQGDAGSYNTTGNVLNTVMTLTLQPGEVVTALNIQSSGYTDPGKPYAYALRGMKNFRFELV